MRFLESRLVTRLNNIPQKSITVIKNRSEIRMDDIVIGYCHTESSLSDMNEIQAFKAVNLIHFYGTKEESDMVRKARPDVLVNESDLSVTSALFRKTYSWYHKKFIVQSFVAAPRFNRNKAFNKRANRCFSTGTITYRQHKDFLDVYGNSCVQPTRKQILEHKKAIETYCECYNSEYAEDSSLKKYLSTDNFFVHYYKVWYNLTHVGKQKKYFSFNMVDKFNEFKMCLVGEEVIGVPGIGFVEGMSCGCAYIGQNTGFYDAYGMVSGVHYIGYDGTLDDLKSKIYYYQQPEHQEELEQIANNGYTFAREHFKGYNVAKDLLDNLMTAQKEWKASK
jgi:hypothetical protein